MREHTLKTLLEAIARTLVDQPDEVHVKELKGPVVTILQLRVAPDEVGRVIGRHGATAEAIRVLLRAAGGKEHRNYRLEIVEPN